MARRDTIVSIDKVREEINRNEDKLTEWCRNELPERFWKSSEVAANSYIKIARWAAKAVPRYKQSAISEFLHGDNADAFLIAYALENVEKRVLVTYEVGNESPKRIKIPDACVPFSVQVIQPNQMFRELGEQL